MTRTMLTRLLLVALAVSTAVTITITTPQEAEARPAIPWDPGYIISDQVFYDSSTMNAAQIQTFLNQRVPNCQAGYTCLKDYKENTPTISASAFCKGYTGARGETAAQMIAKVAQSCGINPRVLLVTLEKEMSLVSHTWPSQWRFDKALGYACPDTAPCNPEFGVFIYQLYYGAQQFKRYQANPTSYNYQAGRNNQILFHPNGASACGISTVYIQNQATAGLYNYTPYQPNTAALNNLYGTGNACSSYGNRNFWVLFWDWFGSPITSSPLVKAADSNTIYLINGSTKHAIVGWQNYLALSAQLGTFAIVSNSYIDSISTGIQSTGLYRNQAGTIGMLIEGRLHAFPSCAVIENYGYPSCGGNSAIQLTNDLYAKFPSGVTLRQTINGSSGAIYSVSGGAITEYLTTELRTQAGFTDAPPVVSDAFLGQLNANAPVLGPNAAVITSYTNTSRTVIHTNDAVVKDVPVDIANSVNSSVRRAKLTDRSLDAVAGTAPSFPLVAKNSASTALWFVSGGTYSIPASILKSSNSLPTLPTSVTSLFTSKGSVVQDGLYIKKATENRVFVITNGALRPVHNWAALQSIANVSSPALTVVPDALIDNLNQGAPIIRIGSLIRTPEDRSIYFISGIDNRSYVSSFNLTGAAGFSGWEILEESLLAGYAITEQPFGFGFEYDGTSYLASEGQLRKVTAADRSHYPFSFLPIDRYGFARLNLGSEATRFIKTADSGALYYIENGKKRHITTWTTWLQQFPGQTWMVVPTEVVNAFPDGDPIT